MSDSAVVVIKLVGQPNNAQPEPFYIARNISWADLKAMMLALFDVTPSEIEVHYQDDENDKITLSSDNELQEAFRFANATSEGVLQLYVKDGVTDLVTEREDITESDAVATAPVIDESKAEQVPPTETDTEIKDIPPVTVKDERQVKEEAEHDTAETGETSPQYECDEETGLIRSHKPVVRKKACYIEIPGKDRNGNDKGDAQELEKKQSESESAMPYQDFVVFMEKLKRELRTEIVHDVTKKTVKQVLKGLDNAVIRSIQGGASPPSTPTTDKKSAKESKPAHPLYLHEGIFCDNCEKPIIGPRYKCGNCTNFDLCCYCEAIYGIHNPDHVFVKLNRPCFDAGMRDGKKVTLLRRILYKEETEHHQRDAETRAERFAERSVKWIEKMKKREEKVQEKQKKREDKLKRKLEKMEALKDQPKKKEKMDVPGYALPQFKYPYQVLGAEFVTDVTIPDGTHVQPGTRLQKTWRMKNTGSHQWTNLTQMRLMWGTITSPKTEVSAPMLKPGEEGNITVELIAPDEPGRYQSHWKLFDSGVNFGNRVWCSIHVDPKEILEPKTAGEETNKNNAQPVDTDKADGTIVNIPPVPLTKLTPATPIKEQPKDKLKVLEQVETAAMETAADNSGKAADKTEKMEEKTASNILSQDGIHDLLSYEFLDLRDRGTPKVSQTATPNNTPLDVTPPKSPAPEPYLQSEVVSDANADVEISKEGNLLKSPTNEQVLSSSSSLELLPVEDNPTDLSDYITERMASLELKPEVEDDVESFSSGCDYDSDLSEDYCIVPLPDCFDTTKPLTRSTMGLVDDNQNTIGLPDSNKYTAGAQPSLDELLSTSGGSLQGALMQPTIAGGSPLNSADSKPAEEDCSEENQAECVKKEVSEKLEQLVDSVEQMSKISNEEAVADASVEPESTGINKDAGAQDDSDKTVPEEDEAAKSNDSHAATEFVNQLMQTAMYAAVKAGAKAFSTTRGVFNTLQAKQWKPPQSNYKPPSSTWTPAPDNYVPPQSNWKPPDSTWTPPEETVSSKPSPDPLDRLVEMGFANRPRNKELLAKHNNDLEPVLQELLQENDNDWANRRY